MATELKFHLCDTGLGWIGLAISAKGLRATTTPRRSREEALREVSEMGALEPAGEGDHVDLGGDIDWDNLSASGRGVSGFRRAVLEETLRIPAGETRSYGWLARKVGRPRAARAVGRVMATNPLPVVVPCHRVVGSDGSLHGYGGGLDVKAALLRAEGARA